MNSIERRLEKLEETANSGEIRSFEEMMSECVRIMTALREGVKLDSIEVRRFDSAMKAGIVRSLPDLEQAMCEAQDSLPLEIVAQLILIYRAPDARALLTPTLKELVEQVLELERAGRLAVG